MKKRKVLIVGGGFGGVKTALELCQDEQFDVTLLSDNQDMLYYPALYHTATGGKRSNSSIPFEHIFRGKQIKLAQGVAKTLDRKAKKIIVEGGNSYHYDSLVLALGVVTNYFGIPGLDEYSYNIKTQAGAQRFKSHLHQQLVDQRRPDLNYVVVGAGPTGIELAGALPSYLLALIERHNLPRRKVHVDLIEAAPRLLPMLPKQISRSVRRRLKKLGVRLYLNSVVQGETADELTISGKPIRSHTVVWTAGVTNHPFFKENNFVLMGRGKVAVDTFLQTEPDIFVIGDNANTPYSGLAQTALHDGESVARNLKLQLTGKDMKSYIARRPVTVIPAGPRWAAVIWGSLKFSGWLGHLLREAADFKGFHTLEPWQLATKQWLSEFDYNDSCEICAKSNL